MNWLRERREARKWIENHEVSGAWSQRDPAQVRIDSGIGPALYGRAVEAPWTLRMFGEERLAYIHLDRRKLSQADIRMIDRLQALFPEADGVLVNEEPGWAHRWRPNDDHAYLKSSPSAGDEKNMDQPDNGKAKR